MASSSRATPRSSGPVLPSSFSGGGSGGSAIYRSAYSAVNSTTTNRHSYSSYNNSSPYSSSPSSFASSTFSTARGSPSGFFTRSASPTRVNLPQPSSSVRFALDSRSISPSSRPVVARRSGSSSSSSANSNTTGAQYASRAQPRRTCMCSPTNHPGSFRCALHKNAPASNRSSSSGFASCSTRLNARRSAMTNSLVRIGTVEGDLVKRALAALIRPSSHQQRRRNSFQPRPSRLSAMSRADVTAAA